MSNNFRIFVTMKRLTTAEFIAKARATHGDKYDYSKVVYVNAKTKVCIICPEHGEFWQTPDAHLAGKKCKKCSGILIEDTESFIAQAKIKHQNYYSYPNTVYVGKDKEVEIECPTHGKFYQTPASHIRGAGCHTCGRIKNEEGKSSFYKAKRPDLSHVKTPPGSKAVPVGIKGDYALVDEEDYERVMEHNWCPHSKGEYAGSRINGKFILMHRFIMNPPDGMEVDHIFHNTLDNRKSQLRVCTRKENMWNLRKRSGGTSKYMGVSWDKKHKKWLSCIRVNNKSVSLGLYCSEYEAAVAYDKAAAEHRYGFTNLNLIGEL